MRVSVVVPVVDRNESLRRLLGSLAHQTLLPEQVVVSVPDPERIDPELRQHPLVTLVSGAKGAAAQRNAGMRAVHDGVDLIVFVDDDTVLEEQYLERACDVMADPGIVALNGRVVRDGVAAKRPLRPEEMSEAMRQAAAARGDGVTPIGGLYGMNMVVRAQDALETPFDEALPLYSWLEDLDFSHRLARRGRMVRAEACICVHEGSASGGRTQHLRLGYSQVSNVLHLLRKGTVRRREALRLIGRPLLASLWGSLASPEADRRRARLRGMGLALADAARGRITPGRITRL